MDAGRSQRRTVSLPMAQEREHVNNSVLPRGWSAVPQSREQFIDLKAVAILSVVWVARWGQATQAKRQLWRVDAVLQFYWNL
jgi:hypothetical protein